MSVRFRFLKLYIQKAHLVLISELTESVLGYGFIAATAVSVTTSSLSPSNVTKSIAPIAVYPNTRHRTPEIDF